MATATNNELRHEDGGFIVELMDVPGHDTYTLGVFELYTDEDGEAAGVWAKEGTDSGVPKTASRGFISKYLEVAADKAVQIGGIHPFTTTAEQCAKAALAEASQLVE